MLLMVEESIRGGIYHSICPYVHWLKKLHEIHNDLPF